MKAASLKSKDEDVGTEEAKNKLKTQIRIFMRQFVRVRVIVYCVLYVY